MFVCRGYKVGSKDEKYRDTVKLFKEIFCVTILALASIIIALLLVFGITVFIVRYDTLCN